MPTFTIDALAAEIKALQVSDQESALAALNAPSDTGSTVWRSDVAPCEVLACVEWAEVADFDAAQWSAVQCLLSCPPIDATQPAIRAVLAGLFARAPQTLQAILASASVAKPTRAEQLWGAGHRVYPDAVAAALEGLTR